MTKNRSIPQALPAALRSKIEITEAGNDRPEKEVAWFYRYLECGDHILAALDVGYEDDEASAQGRRLKNRYAEFIREGLIHVGQADLPLAAETLRKVMRAYDPSARIKVRKELRNGDVLEYEDADPVRSSPAMASAAVKAAESFADRFGLPKVTKFEDNRESAESQDFRLLIDNLVSKEGLEAVRRLPTIMDHLEYRKYFEDSLAAGKYGQGIIDVTSTDVTPDPPHPVSGGAGDDAGAPPTESPAGEEQGTVNIEIGDAGQGGPLAGPSSELDYLGLGD